MGLFRKKKSKKSAAKSGSCNASGFCSKSCNGGNCANVLSTVNTNQQSVMSVSPAGATKTFIVIGHTRYGYKTEHPADHMDMKCVKKQGLCGGDDSGGSCTCGANETPKVISASSTVTGLNDINDPYLVTTVTVGCFN